MTEVCQHCHYCLEGGSYFNPTWFCQVHNKRVTPDHTCSNFRKTKEREGFSKAVYESGYALTPREKEIAKYFYNLNHK